MTSAAAVKTTLRQADNAFLAMPAEEAATTGVAALFPALTANRRLSAGQERLLAFAIPAFGLMLLAEPVAMGVALNAAFLLFTLSALGLRALLLFLSLRTPRSTRTYPCPPEDSLPAVTILCPAYKEAESLPGLLLAIEALDYPKERLDVKLLLEADDRETIAATQETEAPFPLSILIIPEGGPRTKPKACNHGLHAAKGTVTVIYDAEDRPEPSQLRRAAAAFAALPEDIACLQARLAYYNREESWLTRLFTIEYALLFDLVLPGLARLGAPLPLGGTSNFFRTDALLRAGGWDAFNVTEDADLGLRLAHLGLHTDILDSTTYELATSRTKPWIRQRSRWLKGYLQTWIVHMRRRPASRPRRHALTLHFMLGAVVVAALLNPIFWAAYALWLGSLLVANSPLDLSAFFPGPLAGLALIALLLGNAFQLWLLMLAPLRRGWHDLVPYALLAPAYWTLQSVAGYKALWQFVFRPFFWEKTQHAAGEPLAAVLAKLEGQDHAP